MLGRKQSVRNNEDWKNALDHIEETVSKKELDSLVKKTVKDIKEKCKGKKAAYAWSAGKDSLVLGEICEKAGIDQSVLVRCNLEYPAFVAWIEQNKPSGLEIINTGQDMEWLKKHPDMLFPDKSNKAAQWFHIVQHRGQARYYKEHQLEILLLGRRKADGNYVGKDNIYTNSAGITRYSPLAEWRHEDILAYIHYYDVKLPPMDNKLSAPLSTLQWVNRDSLKPNDYNPNKVSKENLKLLIQSILTNGWTLPIVVRPDMTIIDGFHRWTVAGMEPLRSKLDGKVPVVVVEHKEHSEDIYGTVTHNRARGTHLLEPMKKIIKELMDDGKTVEEISKQLGMRPEEIFRLSDFSKEDFLKMMTKGVTGYSKAEFITKV